MPFSDLDCASIARSLSQLLDRDGDIADAFFECREESSLSAGGRPPGIRVRRDCGFAIRLLRGGTTWLAARDGYAAGSFRDALRQVARALPSTLYPEPRLRVSPQAIDSYPGEDVWREFPARVDQAVRRRLAAFPMQLDVRRHRRWIRVVTTQLLPDAETEEFFSCEAQLPWSRYGGLLHDVDETTADRVAESVTALFRSRDASPPRPGPCPLVLGPEACAVLLHEVVAHALETDTLILGGKIEAAIGLELGAVSVNVLDDPDRAPQGVRRTSDDEGTRVARRWLLRRGVVEQPLADLYAAQQSTALVPGAGRRGSRFAAPVPRSTHLEMLPGDAALEDLLADLGTGLFVPECASGRLDPLTGVFTLRFPYGRRLQQGKLAEWVGAFGIQGRVSELLASVSGVADVALVAGAGWCAKGGVRLPVWATCPAVRLEDVEVVA